MLSAILGPFPLQFFELIDVIRFLKIFLLSASKVVRSKETAKYLANKMVQTSKSKF